jgi:beta-lactam-binding protein with PASTA domain
VLVARREQPSARPTAGPAAPPPVVPLRAVSAADGSTCPDLRGLSAREALRALARVGLTVRLQGAGVVVDQEPEPGAPIERGASVTLWLERQALLRVSNGTEP